MSSPSQDAAAVKATGSNGKQEKTTLKTKLEAIPKYNRGQQGTYRLSTGKGTVEGTIVSFCQEGDFGLMFVKPPGKRSTTQICIGRDTENPMPVHSTCA